MQVAFLFVFEIGSCCVALAILLPQYTAGSNARLHAFFFFYYKLAGQPCQSFSSSGYQVKLVLLTVWHANLLAAEMIANIPHPKKKSIDEAARHEAAGALGLKKVRGSDEICRVGGMEKANGGGKWAIKALPGLGSETSGIRRP